MEQCQLVFSAEAINVWGAWIVVRQLRDLLSIHVLLRSALDEKERDRIGFVVHLLLIGPGLNYTCPVSEIFIRTLFHVSRRSHK